MKPTTADTRPRCAAAIGAVFVAAVAGAAHADLVTFSASGFVECHGRLIDDLGQEDAFNAGFAVSWNGSAAYDQVVSDTASLASGSLQTSPRIQMSHVTTDGVTTLSYTDSVTSAFSYGAVNEWIAAEVTHLASITLSFTTTDWTRIDLGDHDGYLDFFLTGTSDAYVIDISGIAPVVDFDASIPMNGSVNALDILASSDHSLLVPAGTYSMLLNAGIGTTSISNDLDFEQYTNLQFSRFPVPSLAAIPALLAASLFRRRQR